MSKVKEMFGEWVLLEPIKEDLAKRTSLSMPDDMQKPQNMATVIDYGRDVLLIIDEGDVVIHGPSSLKVTLEGKNYIIVKAKDIIGRVENE